MAPKRSQPALPRPCNSTRPLPPTRCTGGAGASFRTADPWGHFIERHRPKGPREGLPRRPPA
jgi:hypothetical protein